jgi:alpha-D-ribose 1-methylphosphonate 5-triphosphate diphosphatase
MDASGVGGRSYCLTDVWAVLPDRVVTRATVDVDAGVIVGVVEDGPAPAAAIDGRGLVCVPGLVDLHGTPPVAPEATGVTTRFEPAPISSSAPPRSPAAVVGDGVNSRHLLIVDLEDPAAVADVAACAGRAALRHGPVLASISDRQGRTHPDGDDLLDWLTIQARADRFRLLAKNPVTADDVDRAADWGAAAVVFPRSVDAARRARERGLRVVAEATLGRRDRTRSCGIGGAALAELDLCDALVSVDSPQAMLHAVSWLVANGIRDLPGAVHLVTGGPAAVAGLDDRGRIGVGRRGDLALLEPRGERFVLRHVLRADDTRTPTRSRADVQSTA